LEKSERGFVLWTYFLIPIPLSTRWREGERGWGHKLHKI